MRAFLSIAIIGFSLATAHAEPQAQPQAPGPPASAQRSDADRVICRNRMATGSRLAYARDCHTRAEWDFITRSSQDFTTGIQQRSFELNNPPGGGGH
ncbi:MAG TPA: hypothetical protein VLC74_05985 [Rhizomicrobium sp.]|nr:hypothetical protein [Rhizomicrobium sp.]